jgi:hypothetical protein
MNNAPLYKLAQNVFCSLFSLVVLFIWPSIKNIVILLIIIIPIIFKYIAIMLLFTLLHLCFLYLSKVSLLCMIPLRKMEEDEEPGEWVEIDESDLTGEEEDDYADNWVEIDESELTGDEEDDYADNWVEIDNPGEEKESKTIVSQFFALICLYLTKINKRYISLLGIPYYTTVPEDLLVPETTVPDNTPVTDDNVSIHSPDSDTLSINTVDLECNHDSDSDPDSISLKSQGSISDPNDSESSDTTQESLNSDNDPVIPDLPNTGTLSSPITINEDIDMDVDVDVDDIELLNFDRSPGATPMSQFFIASPQEEVISFITLIISCISLKAIVNSLITIVLLNILLTSVKLLYRYLKRLRIKSIKPFVSIPALGPIIAFVLLFLIFPIPLLSFIVTTFKFIIIIILFMLLHILFICVYISPYKNKSTYLLTTIISIPEIEHPLGPGLQTITEESEEEVENFEKDKEVESVNRPIEGVEQSDNIQPSWALRPSNNRSVDSIEDYGNILHQWIIEDEGVTHIWHIEEEPSLYLSNITTTLREGLKADYGTDGTDETQFNSIFDKISVTSSYEEPLQSSTGLPLELIISMLVTVAIIKIIKYIYNKIKKLLKYCAIAIFPYKVSTETVFQYNTDFIVKHKDNPKLFPLHENDESSPPIEDVLIKFVRDKYQRAGISTVDISDSKMIAHIEELLNNDGLKAGSLKENWDLVMINKAKAPIWLERKPEWNKRDSINEDYGEVVRWLYHDNIFPINFNKPLPRLPHELSTIQEVSESDIIINPELLQTKLSPVAKQPEQLPLSAPNSEDNIQILMDQINNNWSKMSKTQQLIDNMGCKAATDSGSFNDFFNNPHNLEDSQINSLANTLKYLTTLSVFILPFTILEIPIIDMDIEEYDKWCKQIEDTSNNTPTDMKIKHTYLCIIQ